MKKITNLNFFMNKNNKIKLIILSLSIIFFGALIEFLL